MNGNQKKIKSLLALFGPWCHVCGFEIKHSIAKSGNDQWCASVDHIVPLSKGGTNDLVNLRLAHRKCNSLRGVGQEHWHDTHFKTLEKIILSLRNQGYKRKESAIIAVEEQPRVPHAAAPLPKEGRSWKEDMLLVVEIGRWKFVAHRDGEKLSFKVEGRTA